jgi:glycosyltransferase involved in cell wall biosynthesis
MKVLVCSERFLSRFGADRVLILLGQRLAALGHHVVWLGMRFEETNLAGDRAEIVRVPTDGVEYPRMDAHTAEWLRGNWERVAAGDAPGLAIVGGWPFYAALPFLRSRCPAIAVDFGAVPLDGYSGAARAIQEQVRALRAWHLGSASLIVAISRFIAESQSEPDSRGRVPVVPILLGADHMDAAPASPRPALPGSAAGVDAIAALHRAGRKAVLALGRWEPGCYKNSEGIFELIRLIQDRVPGSAVLLLAPAADVDVPADLRDVVVPVGFPGDRELAAMMAAADLGVSLSLWEGFNLPLAEMQWLGRGALVFDRGAHPEVVADPWYLCRDLTEMADKAVRVLSGDPERAGLSRDAANRFRRDFRWERFFRQFLSAVAPLVGAALTRGAVVIIDVTNATRDPANTGVIRVTRRLGRTLQGLASPAFVVWDDQVATYVFPTAAELGQLGAFNGPAPPADLPVSPTGGPRALLTRHLPRLWAEGPCCLLVTETIQAPRARAARAFATHHGIPLAAIFYDAIPVLYPDLCPNAFIRENHGAYMRELAACDLVLPISEFSGRCLEEYWAGLALEGGQVVPLRLPGELGAERRPAGADADGGPTIRMLCVSTLEPRKNHAALFAACRLLDERFPGLDWSLDLVGNRYAGAFEIADMVEDVAGKDHRIQWLGVVPDEELAALYASASLTVYPSLVEGFGLPVLESLWAGTPCICRDQGVMAELAAGGGCLTVDVSDPAALCDAIGRLATDPALRRRLGQEARRRPITTWTEYAIRVGTALLANGANPRPASAETSDGSPFSFTWEDVLYPRCLTANWQQDHSERLAIAAVLMRHRPGCSIEIGTYRGGSLSLISQHSSLVFSIDIEPASPDLLARFPDVTFLRGSSPDVLPIIFRELDAAGIPVDFILVDGDHSAAGVARDIDSILDYVPKAPLFVLLHDSFNPDCRQGMRDAPWARSPHVQQVDLDFVPGRVVENGGPFDGQMWGGLAAAYLTPERRVGDLLIQASTNRMFQKLHRLQYPGT